jgi:hypothetical protein
MVRRHHQIVLAPESAIQRHRSYIGSRDNSIDADLDAVLAEQTRRFAEKPPSKDREMMN